MSGHAHRKQPYPYVTSWGRYLGSRDRYIEEQVAQAVVDGAPTDAIFKDTDGVWHTLAALGRRAPKLRARIEAEGYEQRQPAPPAAN
jgi:hypothetical protein